MSWLKNASRKKKWLVGVSGGADSVALLHWLAENGFSKLVVCHLDHRLRGRASTGDAKFVEKLAAKLGAGFEGGRADVKKLAKERKESLETAARGARHDFFRECAAKHRCHRVVLAHHADDQAETVLWNLLRGSHGLKGMKEVQKIGELEFHRPLLDWRREGIREWLCERKLAWREDATNAEPVAVRNRIRNEILPLLAEISGRDSVGVLMRLMRDWEDQEAITDFALEKVDVIDPQGRIYLPTIRTLPVSLQRAAVARYLAGNAIPVDRSAVERVIELIDPSGPPTVNLPTGKRFRRRAGRGFVE